MGWRDFISNDGEVETLPWTGGGSLHSSERVYKLRGQPPEHGWYRFKIEGKHASDPVSVESCPELLKQPIAGYLVGDRLVPDDTRIDPDPTKIVDYSQKVYMLPEELDRFARVRAGRIYPEGPLIFLELAFPLGPEDAVMNAYLDDQKAVHEIPGVVPALDAAFRMESYRREQAEMRRQEIARRRAEEAERLRQEQLRKELLERLGDGAGRRAMAQAGDFSEAAKAALKVGGAFYLDHRKGIRGGEWIVKYRVDGQRLECICDTNLHIVDAGICLTDHDTEEKGDTYFTLESLPSVVREAVRQNKLVVWRHG